MLERGVEAAFSDAVPVGSDYRQRALSGPYEWIRARSEYARLLDLPAIRAGLHQGVLVKEIKLADLWPPDDFPKGPLTSGTATWFDEGAFTFSPDDGTLVYKSPSGQTVRITLSTGAVSKDHH